MRQQCKKERWTLFFLFIVSACYSGLIQSAQYTIVNKSKFVQTVLETRADIKSYLNNTDRTPGQDLNMQTEMIVDALRDTPYLYRGAMGEGDWRSSSLRYRPGAVHIDQDPVYR